MKTLLRELLFSFLSTLLITELSAQSKLTVAVDYLKGHSDEHQLKPQDVDDIRLLDQSTEEKSSISHVNLEQYFKGIRVYNAVASVHIGAGNKVVYSTSSFQNDLNKKAINIIPVITPNASVVQALNHLNIHPAKALMQATSSDKPLKLNEYSFAKDNIALQDITSELMLLPSEKDAQVTLVWKVNIYKKDALEWWDVFVDAKTGEIITKNNFVISCSFAPRPETDAIINKKESISASPDKTTAANDFNVLARPNEAPSFAARSIVNSPWTLAPAASPFGWLSDGTNNYTYTRGNNVFAYLDVNNTSPASAANAANAGAGLSFDFPIDFSLAPSTYTNAAITNLFYATNTMHDIWYNYGFNEASRNFQKNNSGKGGTGNDYLNAEAQDSRNVTPCVRDNANMAPSPEGSSPRMQMYLWSSGVNVKINSPGTVAGDYPATSSSFGPCINTKVVTGNLVATAPVQGCSALSNAAAIAGNIALIDRGTCPFLDKIKYAQNAGAIGVIVVNNVPGTPIPLGGIDTFNVINIPAVMISQANGNSIKAALASGAVNATLSSNPTQPELDGDLDNGIIFHEYGHGITNRLTGNGSSCMSNAERGSEGWSDWYALVLTQKPGDDAVTPRGIGTYVYRQPTNGAGIRVYPYSYDMSVDPHTYADIKNVNGEVHYIGEVWCSALWDMFWLMVDKYGYDPDIYNGTGGNNKAMKLVIDGLKLQQCNPGFLDARNAILKADSLYNGAANSCLIWSAFARRGMGLSALQGSASTAGDETPATNTPEGCNVVLPVTLHCFKALPKTEKINITWRTVNEVRNNNFELQRKSSLNEPFVTIGNIATKGSSGADYSFDDINVVPNVTYYYRLIQKDLDAKQSFSQVVIATIAKQSLSNVIAYPNPVEKDMYLKLSTAFGNSADVKITDIQGRILFTKIFKEIPNNNLMLNMSGFAPGVYQVNIYNKNKSAVIKVLKK